MPERKASDVAAALATDLGVGWVVRGVLHYPSTNDTHTVAGKDVDYVLARYVGREVLVVRVGAHPDLRVLQDPVRRTGMYGLRGRGMVARREPCRDRQPLCDPDLLYLEE